MKPNSADRWNEEHDLLVIVTHNRARPASVVNHQGPINERNERAGDAFMFLAERMKNPSQTNGSVASTHFTCFSSSA
jgi:hypothetical protein